MNKTELLRKLQDEYRTWQAFVDGIDPARMAEPGVAGSWSVKDIVAHLTGWQRRLTDRLQAAQRGEPEPPPPWPAHAQSEDDINAWIYDSNRERPMRDIRDESHQALQQFFSAIEALPEDVQIDVEHHHGRDFYFLRLGDQEFVAGEFFDHFHDDHEPDIRAWLARTRKDAKTFQPEPTLVEFIRYHNWANAQILAVCQKLDADQRKATAPGTYGSIHRTLGHMIYAEADYVGRITGHRPQPPFKWEDGPSIDELAAFAEHVADALLDVVQRVPPTQMVHEVEDGLTLDYQARQLFMQTINHGIEHRTNITTILAGLGIATPEIDNWGYMFAHADRFAMKEGKA
jgi:uncharacterized damage-inducible protein DinB